MRWNKAIIKDCLAVNNNNECNNSKRKRQQWSFGYNNKERNKGFSEYLIFGYRLILCCLLWQKSIFILHELILSFKWHRQTDRKTDKHIDSCTTLALSLTRSHIASYIVSFSHTFLSTQVQSYSHIISETYIIFADFWLERISPQSVK